MQYIVCYDIADDGRRERMAKALLDYGRRIQESVFLAALDEELLDRMRARVVKLLEMSEDSLFVFPVCDGCARKAESYGWAALPKDQDYYVV